MTPFPPIDSVMTEAINSTFTKASNSVVALIGMIVIAKFTMFAIQVSGPDRYVAVIKEAVGLMIVIAIFPFVLEIAVSIVGDIAGRFQFERAEVAEGATRELSVALKNESFWVRILSDFGWYALEYSVRAVFSIVLGLMCAALPIILMIEFTFGTRIGVSTIGTMILALLSWPILWNIIGLLSSKLATTDGGTSFSGWIYSVIASVVQLLSPIFCFSLLRSGLPQAAIGSVVGATGFVPGGVKSMAMKSIGLSPKAPLRDKQFVRGGPRAVAKK